MFARLAEWLVGDHPAVVASVTATHGATPRKRDARMLVDADRIAFSVGGGAMEARVLDAARALIRDGMEHQALRVELNGREGAAGVCGGDMHIALRRWQGEDARCRAMQIAAQLAAGERVELHGEEYGQPEGESHWLQPDPRLLVLGAGHCGQALAELARHVGFETWLADDRLAEWPSPELDGVVCIDAGPVRLRAAADTRRDLYLVLLNRDYATDVAALTALHGVRHAFLGMMGSRKRIAQVKKSLPGMDDWLRELVAPVGLEIGAQTPHEIAISILAQLIARRATRAGDQGEGAAFSSR
ncbi:XdhC/CoxI family protein [Xanthomonadaceae bacterium JHOS43]|nr:XdhC/CoxI family protein [Xanthomonadaceae bacterium JHOS43]